ncbi:MAG TPA: ATP-binding cassette domain-containing protein [Actinomycetota bacterium]|jgi:putative ABC transport system ATP-binding protein
MADRLAARCRDLIRVYRTESAEVVALDGVSADFPSAAVTAVVGPSGSGKSSLLRVLAGLDRAQGGSAHVGELELSRLSRRALRIRLRNLVGYVFQKPADNFVSYLTVSEHLQMAGRQAGVTPGAIREVLDRLAIGERADHLPHQLSGGEQQRAAFAQVLVSGASVVLADEPTAELDDGSSEGLLESVRDLARDGTAFVLATHDLKVAEIAHHTVEIEHGHTSPRALLRRGS